MDSSDESHRHIWNNNCNKEVSQNNHTYDPIESTQSQYRVSYGWPNISKKEIRAKILATISTETQQPLPNIGVANKRAMSEYDSKYLPHSAYVCVYGNGFMKPNDLHKWDSVDKHKDWYSEFEERNELAHQYRARSEDDVYGNGFMEPKDLHKWDSMDKTKDWYSEFEERNELAHQYRARSEDDV